MKIESQISLHASYLWSWQKKIWIGFLSAYIFLFNIPFLLEYISPSGYLVELHTDIWNPVIVWVGRNILHLGYEITARPTNSTGDTTWNYVHLFCLAVISTFISIFALSIERGRLNYKRLYEWLLRYIRYSLALALITYGMVKVIKAQFPSPSLETLIHPLGDTSPATLLWSFMGTSVEYNLFAGLGEAIGGVLLFFRRTTLLGSLLCIGVMGNVAMLNYSYDIAVKIYSTHLLLMAVILASQDVERLVNLFFLNRPTASVEITPAFQHKRMNHGAFILKTSILVLFVTWQGTVAYQSWRDASNPKLRSALRGVWNVEEFDLDGKSYPPLTTDTARWRRIAFDYPDRGTIQMMDDTFIRFNVVLDAEKKTLRLNGNNKPELKADLTYEQLPSDGLLISGSFNEHLLRAKLRLSNGQLYSRIFTSSHWIHEKSSFSH